MIDAPAIPGGRAIALCNEDGEMLPMQLRAVVENAVGEFGTITVTFSIDGEQVRFEQP
ncbi:hypothetical protein [Novosphingobium sp. 9]|uniref:hypothetical protein n=1 Tax=Novosphingobium sp. 9 TaxID=2025349 RepID=UPI0021B6B648|nr:hypothetical protein [Novosphingobium sp. 9]